MPKKQSVTTCYSLDQQRYSAKNRSGERLALKLNESIGNIKKSNQQMYAR